MLIASYAAFVRVGIGAVEGLVVVEPCFLLTEGAICPCKRLILFRNAAFMKTCFVSTHRSLRDISSVFAQYLWQHENMEINRFVMPDGEFRVQGRIRNNTLHHLLGWDIRIVIKLHRENEQKIIVALGMLVRTHNIYAVILSVLLLPLLLVSLWGKIYQHLLLFRMQKMIKSLK